MKKLFLLSIALFSIFKMSAQDNYFQYNNAGDVYLKYSTRGIGGRALVHYYDNQLILNYDNDFTGGTKIASNLEVVGRTTLYNNLISLENIQLGHEKQISMSLSDEFTYQGKKFGSYALGWVNDSNNNLANTLWMSGYGGIKFFTWGTPQLTINNLGNVGIGTENPQNKLDVNGTIHAKEVKIDLAGWPDYVFDKDYKLPNLDDVKAHIEEHKHLPGIPSEKQVLEEGVNMGEMQAKLLQKVEELTLYVIQQQEEINTLKTKLGNR